MEYIRSCRYLYNLALADRKNSLKDQKSVKYLEQQNELPKLKKDNFELKRVILRYFNQFLRNLMLIINSFLFFGKMEMRTLDLQSSKVENIL